MTVHLVSAVLYLNWKYMGIHQPELERAARQSDVDGWTDGWIYFIYLESSQLKLDDKAEI